MVRLSTRCLLFLLSVDIIVTHFNYSKCDCINFYYSAEMIKNQFNNFIYTHMCLYKIQCSDYSSLNIDNLQIKNKMQTRDNVHVFPVLKSDLEAVKKMFMAEFIVKFNRM